MCQYRADTARKQALNYLRHAEGGRYQVKTQSESVYWSPRSRLRAGKAYYKGPHVRYQVAKQQAQLTSWQLEACDRLLRLELKLGGQWWRERTHKPWHEWIESEFDIVHTEYFSQFVGEVEVMETENMLEKLEQVAPTKGQAQAAYRTWALIRELGLESTRAVLANGLGTYLNGIDPVVIYFLSRSGLTDAFAILGTAIVFRLTRKLVTLGRW